jgi:hypothetical protein
MLTEKQLIQATNRNHAETLKWYQAMLDEQRRTNELLEQLLAAMQRPVVTGR